MKGKMFISLPKNISYSVFEALKLHADLFEQNNNRKVIFLSRAKNVCDSRIKYFDNVLALFFFLRKQKNADFYGITVFEVLLGFFSSMLGFRKSIIFWVQGLIDEEDFLSNGKRWRYWSFKFLLIISVKISDKLVVVTKKMFEVLVERYYCKSNKLHIVINCTSRVSYNNTEKITNSLCYIGGLSNWQNIDKILLFFSRLLDESREFFLYIATFDHEKAKELLNDHLTKEKTNQVSLLKITTKSEVENFLSRMKYGFLLRDNILLNNVASPIKLAEYLSCGVNPIISNSLLEFNDLVMDYKCGIVVHGDNHSKAISKLLDYKHSTQNAILAYETYFTRESLKDEIEEFLA